MRRSKSGVLQLFLVVSAILICSQGLPQQGADGRPWRLRDFIRVALQNSPQLQAAQYHLDAAASSAWAARWERLPKFRANLTYEGFPWRDKLVTPRHMDIPVPPFTQDQMTTFFRNQFVRNVYNFGGGVTLPVYTGGRIGAQIAAANYGVDAAEEGVVQTRDDLVFQVAQAYYTILKAQHLIAANQAAVDNLNETKRIVQTALSVGKAAPLDTLRVNARLANVEQQLIRSQFLERRAFTRLNVLLGERDLSKQYAVADTLPFEPERSGLEEAMEKARQRNPDYRAARARLEIQKRKRSVARSMLFPTLNLTAAYRGVLSEKHDTAISDGMILLSLSFPVIDGTLWNQLAAESAAVRQAEQLADQTELAIAGMVRSAYLDVLEAEERVRAMEKVVEEARESLRIENLKLETGKGIVNDVLDAQADQLRAEVNYIEALADYNVARVALQRAIGRIEFK